MTDNKPTYTCPHHKVEINGHQRETFQKEFYDALMWVDMITSMRLYKDVKVSCHCKENYDAFDAIIKGASAPETTLGERSASKASTMFTSPMAPEDLIDLASSTDPKDTELTTK